MLGFLLVLLGSVSSLPELCCRVPGFGILLLCLSLRGALRALLGSATVPSGLTICCQHFLRGLHFFMLAISAVPYQASIMAVIYQIFGWAVRIFNTLLMFFLICQVCQEMLAVLHRFTVPLPCHEIGDSVWSKLRLTSACL